MIKKGHIMKYFATINENIEIEMLRELLESNDIIINTKHRETGEFMVISAGMTMFGVDLYVDEDQYDQALELYNAFFAGIAEIDEADLIQEALTAEEPEELFEDETNEEETVE